MRTYIPPVQPQGLSPEQAGPFWSRYTMPVGVSVIRDGDTFRTIVGPTTDELEGLDEGQDYFLGGHIYKVTDEVWNELQAAGLTGGVSIQSGYGWGYYGGGPYGTGSGDEVYGAGTFGSGRFGH